MTQPTQRKTLGDAELTLSGVLTVNAPEAGHISLTSALQLSLQVIRLVRESHDKGQVVGVLDAAHLICGPNGLTIGGAGGNPIAPELKRGDMPDRLTDVYALGALMYRLLTGRKVDQARVIEPPSHFNPAVDTSLDDLVLCTLDEDPSERPYSARDLERRLLSVYDELGLEDTRTEMTNLIASGEQKRKAARPVKPVTDAAPRRVVRQIPAVVDLDATMDHDEVGDEDDDWQPVMHRNPLEKKWMIGGGIALAVFLLAFIAWPSAKKETPRARDEAPVAKVVAAPPQPKVEAKLVMAEPAKAKATPPQKAKSPKTSTRRARR